MVVGESILGIVLSKASMHTESSWNDPTIECTLPVHVGRAGRSDGSVHGCRAVQAVHGRLLVDLAALLSLWTAPWRQMARGEPLVIVWSSWVSLGCLLGTLERLFAYVRASARPGVCLLGTGA